jgi:hypothetical protein
MVRCVLARRRLPLLILAVTAACSSGKSEPTTPAPATTRASTTAPATVHSLPVPALEGYELAVNRGTRGRNGAPGPRYWQQWADYTLQAELNPVSKRMTGKGTIKYYNRSPDTLRTVYIQLLQNIYARGSSSPASPRRGPASPRSAVTERATT